VTCLRGYTNAFITMEEFIPSRGVLCWSFSPETQIKLGQATSLVWPRRNATTTVVFLNKLHKLEGDVVYTYRTMDCNFGGSGIMPGSEEKIW